MSTIHEKLKKVNGYLLSVQRNLEYGTYELEVGIHKDWVYRSTEKIECELIGETDTGRLLKIKPNSETIIIDDLVNFVNIIIETNQKILEMKKEFEEEMMKIKENLVGQQKEFMEKLDQVKELSFELEKKGEVLNEETNKKDNNEKDKTEDEKNIKEELQERWG